MIKVKRSTYQLALPSSAFKRGTRLEKHRHEMSTLADTRLYKSQQTAETNNYWLLDVI